MKYFMTFLFVLLMPAATVLASADAGKLRTALTNDLQDYLASRRTIEHISALSLSVNIPGDISNVNATAGTTRFGDCAPVTPENIYQIGSNTKAFTAVAILQLEAEGKLTIHDTVGKWLPQYPAWKDVTIEQLLHMTSGIPTYDDMNTMQVAYAADPTRDWSAAEIIAFVYPTTKGAPPPTKGWSYSNTNYLLGQLVIEKVSGRSYGEELRRRFFENPVLHLASTYYQQHLYPPAVRDRMVSGYFASKDPDNAGLQSLYGKDVRDLSMSWAQGAGGVVSTPEDITRWSRALYEGDLLKPRQRQELMSIVSMKTGLPIKDVTSEDPRGFGLGVGCSLVPSIGKFWFYEGETLGYRMVYAWFPESENVVAVGINSQPNDKENHAGKLLETIHATLQKGGKL